MCRWIASQPECVGDIIRSQGDQKSARTLVQPHDCSFWVCLTILKSNFILMVWKVLSKTRYLQPSSLPRALCNSNAGVQYIRPSIALEKSAWDSACTIKMPLLNFVAKASDQFESIFGGSWREVFIQQNQYRCFIYKILSILIAQFSRLCAFQVVILKGIFSINKLVIHDAKQPRKCKTFQV